ncbi:MAG: siphovirus Gp157 family protein, partial [Oscillospiraceae bacterium]|nr:siphovirus Gp157 family protein [Oscillospiraceae bacterium]
AAAARAGETSETARCAVSFRATPAAVHLDDPETFAAWCHDAGQYDYLRYKPPEVNKTAVKEALKAGVELPGAYLEKGRSMSIK